MKMKKKKIIVSVLFALCCGLCIQAASALDAPTTGKAATAQIEAESGLADEYEINSGFVAPTVELNYNGQTVQVEGSLVKFPQGRIYDGTQSCKLDEYGVYTVVYYATVNGKRVQAEASFKVSNHIFSVTTSASMIEYEEALYMNAAKSGLHVTLSDGDVFSYNEIINLGTEDEIIDLVDMAQNELRKPEPKLSRLRNCLTLIAPMITIANGMPTLVSNLQKLQDFIMQYIN